MLILVIITITVEKEVKHMAKYSHQRELIKRNMLSRYDHPTADAVYTSIRQEIPNISLGTVYRNLKLLVEQGELLSLDIGDGKEHFDGTVAPHYHFICDNCRKVYDIMMDKLNIEQLASDHFDGDIYGHKTYFYGLCSDCKTNKSH